MVNVISIRSPKKDSKQPWGTKVRGRAWDSCGKEEVVQLMVLAADDKWYPQPAVKRQGTHFRGKAYLGWEDNPNAKTYTIAAGIGGERVKDVVDELPEDVLWTKVTVERI